MSKEGTKGVLQQRIQKDLTLKYKMICAMLLAYPSTMYKFFRKPRQ